MSKVRADVSLPAERIRDVIFVVREQRVMLDADLAALYGVETRALIQAVKRNQSRFPVDFMFQLSDAEFAALRSQTVISNTGRGGRRSNPYVFTEHGAIQASNVLSSRQAIEMGVYVVRAFVQLRETLASHAELARQLRALEVRMLKKFATQDATINDILDTLRQLTAMPAASKRPIGFVIEEPKAGGTRARGSVERSELKKVVKREPTKRRLT
jgi:hypothetical protein